MSFLFIGIAALVTCSGGGHNSGTLTVAWTEPAVACSDAPEVCDMAFPEVAGDQNDPEFRSYQEGYHCILGEKWTEAREKLKSFMKKYPKSQYIDDARYWSAYALKRIDRKNAVGAYVRFITEFPNSRYYDDAVADLTELSRNDPVTIAKYIDQDGTSIYVARHGKTISVDSSGAVISNNSDSMVIDRHGKPLSKNGKNLNYTFGYAPNTVMIREHSLESLSRALSHLRMPPFGMAFAPMAVDPHMDKATKLKIEALHALTESKDDTAAFTASRTKAGSSRSRRPSPGNPSKNCSTC